MTYECSCEGDPAEVCSTTDVKAARKAHRCDECSAHIKVGQPYEYTWGRWEGENYTFKICTRCVELRTWAKISVPCFCWTYSQMHSEVANMVSEVRREVPGIVAEFEVRKKKIVRGGGNFRGEIE